MSLSVLCYKSVVRTIAPLLSKNSLQPPLTRAHFRRTWQEQLEHWRASTLNGGREILVRSSEKLLINTPPQSYCSTLLRKVIDLRVLSSGRVSVKR